jgi:hypothetical protein
MRDGALVSRRRRRRRGAATGVARAAAVPPIAPPTRCETGSVAGSWGVGTAMEGLYACKTVGASGKSQWHPSQPHPLRTVHAFAPFKPFPLSAPSLATRRPPNPSGDSNREFRPSPELILEIFSFSGSGIPVRRARGRDKQTRRNLAWNRTTTQTGDSNMKRLGVAFVFAAVALLTTGPAAWASIAFTVPEKYLTRPRDRRGVHRFGVGQPAAEGRLFGDASGWSRVLGRGVTARRRERGGRYHGVRTTYPRREVTTYGRDDTDPSSGTGPSHPQ